MKNNKLNDYFPLHPVIVNIHYVLYCINRISKLISATAFIHTQSNKQPSLFRFHHGLLDVFLFHTNCHFMFVCWLEKCAANCTQCSSLYWVDKNTHALDSIKQIQLIVLFAMNIMTTICSTIQYTNQTVEKKKKRRESNKYISILMVSTIIIVLHIGMKEMGEVCWILMRNWRWLRSYVLSYVFDCHKLNGLSLS
jgi:hypothetical protein